MAEELALVKIKGMGKIEIDPMKARSVKADWSNPAMPRDMKVDLGDVWAGELGEILGFKIPQVRYHEEENLVDKTSREWKAHRKEIQGMSISERSEMLGLFKLFWFGLTYTNPDWHHVRNEPPKDALEQAREIQYEFFKDNPKRLIVNPSLFRPIFKKRKLGITNITVLNIIERALSADIRETEWELKGY